MIKQKIVNPPKRDSNGRLLAGQKPLNPLGRPKKEGEKLLWELWKDYGSVKFKQALIKGRPWAIKELMKKIFSDRKAQEFTSGEDGFTVILKQRDKEKKKE